MNKVVPRARALAKRQARKIRPEVIDEPWKDDVVHRFFRVLKRRLVQLEKSERKQGGASVGDVRLLATVERTLERLLEMERQRVFQREVSDVAADDDARARLERKLDERLAAIQELERLEGEEQRLKNEEMIETLTVQGTA